FSDGSIPPRPSFKLEAPAFPIPRSELFGSLALSFEDAIRPRLDRHHVRSRHLLVGDLGANRYSDLCAHWGYHFCSGAISGTDLAADPALCSRRINGPVFKVRDGNGFHLAHDFPATPLAAGNCTFADSRNGGSYPNRSAPT